MAKIFMKSWLLHASFVRDEAVFSLMLYFYIFVKSALEVNKLFIKTNAVRRFDGSTIIIKAKWLFRHGLNINEWKQ